MNLILQILLLTSADNLEYKTDLDFPWNSQFWFTVCTPICILMHTLSKDCCPKFVTGLHSMLRQDLNKKSKSEEMHF